MYSPPERTHHGIPIRKLPDGPSRLTGQTRYHKRELHPDDEQWKKWRSPQPSQSSRKLAAHAHEVGWVGLIYFCACGRATDFFRAAVPYVCACGVQPSAEQTSRR
uniref:Uncharacterized protein n=1 Tax=viral metagenome TaxID=1070528 RepID=A0A6M3J3A9_9ZZZZ